MKLFARTTPLLLLLSMLGACDIERVSEGSWDVQIETPDGQEQVVWTVTPEPSVILSTDPPLVASEVDLQGSRIFWTTESPDPANPAGPMLRETFVGTVNGDSLAGTIYTTAGNLSVSATRR